MADQPASQELTFRLDDDVSPGGVYANFAGVWHTEHEFTIDFAALPHSPTGPNSESVEGLVVARVKIPPSVIFAIARAISENVAKFETQYGALTPPPPEPQDRP